LAKDGGTQDQIVLAVIEQEDFDRFFFCAFGSHIFLVPPLPGLELIFLPNQPFRLRMRSPQGGLTSRRAFGADIWL
jgi:hypothetical protein